MRRLVSILLICLACLSPAGADERLLIDEAGLSTLFPQGPVALRTLLATGEVLATSEPMHGEAAHLLVIDPVRRTLVRDVKLPCHRIEHAQANRPGTLALIWSGEGGRLLLVDLATGKVDVVSERQSGKASFGLYTNQRSRIVPMGDDFCAFGFCTTRDGRFDGDWLACVSRSGVKRLMRREDLTARMRQAFPEATAIGALQASSQGVAVAGKNRLSFTGALLVSLNGRSILWKTPLTRFGGMELGANVLTAVLGSATGPATLISTSLKQKAQRTLLSRGQLISPFLSPDEQEIAALEVREDGLSAEKKLRQKIVRYSAASGKALTPVTLERSTLYIDARFVGSRAIHLFDGNGIYRVDL